MYTSSAQNIPCTVSAYRGSTTTVLKRIVLKLTLHTGTWITQGKQLEKSGFSCNQCRVLGPKPGPREIGDMQVVCLLLGITAEIAKIFLPNINAYGKSPSIKEWSSCGILKWYGYAGSEALKKVGWDNARDHVNIKIEYWPRAQYNQPDTGSLPGDDYSCPEEKPKEFPRSEVQPVIAYRSVSGVCDNQGVGQIRKCRAREERSRNERTEEPIPLGSLPRRSPHSTAQRSLETPKSRNVKPREASHSRGNGSCQITEIERINAVVVCRGGGSAKQELLRLPEVQFVNQRVENCGGSSSSFIGIGLTLAEELLGLFSRPHQLTSSLHSNLKKQRNGPRWLDNLNLDMDPDLELD
ncbi:hypothetical protein DFH08DRAFT_803267 [Mycena albidolilacea]|uniref:Uncharacterized protein n=1 Tax=Mycena albidolilacea TaxID=1033008 RepID=A0AAD7ACH4_9AGAR|nr:hypothetical protein DFH08DRAFT_803267 [Mycena albidolilacea]